MAPVKLANTWGVPALLGFAMLANAAMVPLVPFMLATRLGWPLWLVGGYSFAVMSVTMLANQRMSAIVDASQRKSLLCLVCAVFQVVGALATIGALSGAIWLLPLTILGLSVGGAVAPVYYTLGRLIADSEHRDPTTVNSILRVITSAAWVAGPALGFAVVGTQGITAAFGMVAAITALGGVAVLASSRWLDNASTRHATAAKPSTEGARSTSVRRLALPHAAAFAVVFLFSLAHISTANSLALFLVQRFDVPESATGLVLGLKAAVEMITILAAPLLARRFSSRAILTIASVGALITYGSYLFGQGHGVGWALIASVCAGAYYGLFAVTALTWMQSLPGLQLGRSTGSYMNGIYAGVLIGAPLSGFVASFDLGWIAVLSGAASALALGALWFPANAPARASVADGPRAVKHEQGTV